jgi:hypothetical protein
MTKTKAQIRAFLNSKVGKVCVDKSNHRLNGQCVCLIKNLNEFLGIPYPYAARGNAKDYGDALLAQNIGERGRGYLTIVVNRDMGYIGGVRYGHIWVDVKDYANYESNGAKALTVTKNTRPISQGQQFISYDKWIKKESNVLADKNAIAYLVRTLTGDDATKTELDKYANKYTFTKARSLINKWKRSTNAVAKAKAGKLVAKDHLVLPLRSAYKPPASPPPTGVNKASVVEYISKNLK